MFYQSVNIENPSSVLTNPSSTTGFPAFSFHLVQVSHHVKEQLSEIDSGMSQLTAESLFQLYLSLQELYRMNTFLPSRY